MSLETLKCSMANRLWKASCLPGYRRFRRSVDSVEETQCNYLIGLLKKNGKCAYGAEFAFDRIIDVKEYQSQVPLTTYEDYLPYIERIAKGEKRVLTAEEIDLFAPSSGSTSARKLIPYTASLRREFQTAIRPWIFALYSQFPELVNGRSYWSISPPSPDEIANYGCIKVGFDDDSSYLGFIGRKVFSYASVRPDDVSVQDMETFRIRTLCCLLGAEDLRLISVWSPSFLRVLMDWYVQHKDRVIDALGKRPDVSKERIRRLRSIPDQSFEDVWPSLQVISCWTDATSQKEAQRLEKRFPGVNIQGKGLLATEGFVSLPFSSKHDPVLAVDSHFFEFLTGSGECLLSHELEIGETYSVVLTTGGGLYRYRLEDHIIVTGFIGNTPTMRFVGKNSQVSDLFGEKLNAMHVSGLFGKLLGGVSHKFAMLAPDLSNGSCCYTLYIETNVSLPDGLAIQLEMGLRENPHYDYCAAVGQLTAARVFLIAGDACALYLERCTDEGMRLGDSKLAALSKHDGWSEVFQGEYVP